jgi:hypothetical protein
LPFLTTTAHLGEVIYQMLARAITDTASATAYADAEPGSDRKVELSPTGADEEYELDEDEELDEEA